MKPSTTSPLPCPTKEPVRTSPTAARRRIRESWRWLTGRSVPMIIMQDPLSSGAGGADTIRRMAAPAGYPATSKSSNRPKLVCTSAPSVKCCPPTVTMREAEPMPPFNPMHMVPRPAPTSPSSKSAPASAIAAASSAAPTGRSARRFSTASFVSPTTGLTDRHATPSRSHSAMVYATSASDTLPTLSVPVRAIGVSSVPSSSSWMLPAVFP